MLITQKSLNDLRSGYNALWAAGLGEAPTDHMILTEEVSSSAGENIYPWMTDIPGLREWVGVRVLNVLKEDQYRIKNKEYEDSFSVPRSAIMDDTIGTFSKKATLLGRAAARKPCELVYEALKAGFTANCYDGQFFFDTDHQVLDASGNPTSVANTDAVAGSGPAWFLACTTALIKPIILQTREAPWFSSVENPNDSGVFMNNKFHYGAAARWGVGYSFWQLVWGSKQPLTADNFEAARAAMLSFKGDYGRPLGLVPDTLIVPPTLERDANEIVKVDRLANGASNAMQGLAKVHMTPWLA